MKPSTPFGGASAPKRPPAPTTAKKAAKPERAIPAPVIPVEGSPDLRALAVTLIRVAEAAEARDNRLRAAIAEAAAVGDLRLVQRLTRRFGRDPSLNKR